MWRGLSWICWWVYMNWRRLDPKVETARILSLFPRDIKSLICMKFEIDHTNALPATILKSMENRQTNM